MVVTAFSGNPSSISSCHTCTPGLSARYGRSAEARPTPANGTEVLAALSTSVISPWHYFPMFVFAFCYVKLPMTWAIQPHTQKSMLLGYPKISLLMNWLPWTKTVCNQPDIWLMICQKSSLFQNSRKFAFLSTRDFEHSYSRPVYWKRRFYGNSLSKTPSLIG